MPQEPIKVFIAYARKDEEFLNQLRTHLRLLERNNSIEVWYDGKIIPGSKWDDEIKTHLHEAKIILLLVSANSLNSDYFYEKEMKGALERHERGNSIVIPVILRDCVWELSYLKNLQALPKDAKPVTKWNDTADAYSSIVRGINESAENLRRRRTSHTQNIQAKVEKTKYSESIDSIISTNSNNIFENSIIDKLKNAYCSKVTKTRRKTRLQILIITLTVIRIIYDEYSYFSNYSFDLFINRFIVVTIIIVFLFIISLFTTPLFKNRLLGLFYNTLFMYISLSFISLLPNLFYPELETLLSKDSFVIVVLLSNTILPLLFLNWILKKWFVNN